MKNYNFYFFSLLFISYLNIHGQGYSNEFQRTFVNDGEYLKYFDKDKNNIKGTPFVFNTFIDQATLIGIDGKRYLINGVNVDAFSNKFISKITNDSVYVFNLVNKAIIDKRKFDKIEGKIYEVIYEKEKDKILKYFKIKKNKPVIHQMSGSIIKPERFTKIIKYYLFKNSTLTSFKPKKKSILKIMNDKKDEVKSFVKKNDLSFKKEEDLKKIFNYYYNL